MDLRDVMVAGKVLRQVPSTMEHGRMDYKTDMGQRLMLMEVSCSCSCSITYFESSTSIRSTDLLFCIKKKNPADPILNTGQNAM